MSNKLYNTLQKRKNGVKFSLEKTGQHRSSRQNAYIFDRSINSQQLQEAKLPSNKQNRKMEKTSLKSKPSDESIYSTLNIPISLPVKSCMEKEVEHGPDHFQKCRTEFNAEGHVSAECLHNSSAIHMAANDKFTSQKHATNSSERWHRFSDTKHNLNNYCKVEQDKYRKTLMNLPQPGVITRPKYTSNTAATDSHKIRYGNGKSIDVGGLSVVTKSLVTTQRNRSTEEKQKGRYLVQTQKTQDTNGPVKTQDINGMVKVKDKCMLKSQGKYGMLKTQDTNNMLRVQDTNSMVKDLKRMGLSIQSRRLYDAIKKRFELEKEFIKICQKEGIDVVEGDYDEYAQKKHTSVGGLKILGVPKKYICYDEYDPNILVKGEHLFKDYEKRKVVVHAAGLRKQAANMMWDVNNIERMFDRSSRAR